MSPIPGRTFLATTARTQASSAGRNPGYLRSVQVGLRDPESTVEIPGYRMSTHTVPARLAAAAFAEQARNASAALSQESSKIFSISKIGRRGGEQRGQRQRGTCEHGTTSGSARDARRAVKISSRRGGWRGSTVELAMGRLQAELGPSLWTTPARN